VVFDTEIDPDDMGYNAVLQHQWVIISSNWSPPLTFGLMKSLESYISIMTRYISHAHKFCVPTWGIFFGHAFALVALQIMFQILMP
jgi:hypothetical protein